MNFERTEIHGEDQKIVVEQLQVVTNMLIDLTLQAKQVHWNVVGPRFRSIHTHLDELVAGTRTLSDDVAERIVVLGEPAIGAAEHVSTHSPLETVPGRFVQDEEAVKIFVEHLSLAAGRIREAQKMVDARDPVSADLLVRVLAFIEEQTWMFHAQVM